MDQANTMEPQRGKKHEYKLQDESMSQFSSVRTKLDDWQQTQNCRTIHQTDLWGEELQLLLEPASNCGEVIKAMGILALMGNPPIVREP